MIVAKTSTAGSRVQNLLRNYYGKKYESYPYIPELPGMKKESDYTPLATQTAVRHVP